jgi:hypothetical protein
MMHISREATYQCTANPFEPATVLGTRQGRRRSTSRYPSTHDSNDPSRPSEAPALTRKKLRQQARLLEEQRRRACDECEREQSQQTLVPSQQQSRQSANRPSQQSTWELYAPLTSVLPPKPTARDLLSRGFTYAYSTTYADGTKAKDYYEKYSTATRGSKLVQVYDTVGIPSQKR